jgi:predicted DNA-binding transcriptional regulator AlpA
MHKLEHSKLTDPFIDRISLFDKLPDNALADVFEIHVLSGRSIPSLWRDVQEGRLASPIKLGPNSTRWRVGDVRLFLEGAKPETDEQLASNLSEAR